MRCRVTIKDLSSYLDELLSAPEADILKGHIEKCPRCQGHLKSLQEMKQIYRRLAPLEEPKTLDPGFKRKLQERIEREEVGVPIPELVLVPVRRTGQFVRHHAAAVATAAVALLIVLSIGIYQIGGELPRVTSIFGEVEIFDKRGRAVLAKSGLRLHGHELIRTGPNGGIDIDLRGRYVARLKPDGELSIEKLTRQRKRGKTELRLAKGELLLNIKKQLKGAEFIVQSPTAESVARGTGFMVTVDPRAGGATWVGVASGTVAVESHYVPPDRPEMSTVSVSAGEKTKVDPDSVPSLPQKLIAQEWARLQEIYGLGVLPQVALIISAGPERVFELLRPCALYIYDEKPRQIPRALDEAIVIINQAIKEKSPEKHLQAARKLEEMVDLHKDPRYTGQFLLFIGAYYRYIDQYDESIRVFKKVLREYKDRPSFLSLARCATGLIYEFDLKDTENAARAYTKVIKEYPYSPEAEVAREGLQRLSK